ncbi:MAG: hypothetical protein IIT46_03400, partial [Lachnospiraceae bacterium]|nr:hypothetical protein [Lachnospiraceae bacterium]
DLRLLSDLLSPISEPWNDVFQAKKSPQMPCCRASTDFFRMAGAEGFEPSARGFGGNVEISLTLRLLPDFGDLSPSAPLMIHELMLF